MKKILLVIIILILISGGLRAVAHTTNMINNNIVYSIDTHSSQTDFQQYDYLIITSKDLVESISSSTFIAWKTQVGFSLKIITLSDEEIITQHGLDLSEQIRNFLREYYQLWNVKYVLLVGDVETIPMRYCFPDPENHRDYRGYPILYDLLGGGEIPTDLYYADLSLPDSESWDLDGDGYYGEVDDDLPDFINEVFVGRIPTSNKERITYVLDKTVRFEQDTGDWKKNALHAAGFSYFENETRRNSPLEVDGAVLINEIEQNLMDDEWAISHYSEQQGKVISQYPWKALNEESFVNDWRESKYAVVNWAGHGYPFMANRKVWKWDNGNNIPEQFEITYPRFLGLSSNLDDDFPSIIFAKCCLVGYPEKNIFGNLGIDLLTKPGFGAGVNVISCTRSPILQLYYPDLPGGSESMCYEFNRFLIKESNGTETTGEALYHSKLFYNENISFFILWGDIPEYATIAKISDYKNEFNFNLYGDPSLKIEGYSI